MQILWFVTINNPAIIPIYDWIVNLKEMFVFMKKFVVAGLMACLVSVGAMAYASPLVTSNIPLDSPYYQYIDKLEGHGLYRGYNYGGKAL